MRLGPSEKEVKMVPRALILFPRQSKRKKKKEKSESEKQREVQGKSIEAERGFKPQLPFTVEVTSLGSGSPSPLKG